VPAYDLFWAHQKPGVLHLDYRLEHTADPLHHLQSAHQHEGRGNGMGGPKAVAPDPRRPHPTAPPVFTDLALMARPERHLRQARRTLRPQELERAADRGRVLLDGQWAMRWTPAEEPPWTPLPRSADWRGGVPRATGTIHLPRRRYPDGQSRPKAALPKLGRRHQGVMPQQQVTPTGMPSASRSVTTGYVILGGSVPPNTRQRVKGCDLSCSSSRLRFLSSHSSASSASVRTGANPLFDVALLIYL